MPDYPAIRAFTGAEVSVMQAELTRVLNVIRNKQLAYDSISGNPFNYILETQRDAMARMQNSITQDEHIYSQLSDSMDTVIESGDPDKRNEWLHLASIVGDAADRSAWNEQVKYAQTAETAGTVAAETAKDIKETVTNPFGVPLWIWVVGGLTLFIVVKARK